MSTPTILKSVVKKMPLLKTMIAKRSELRLLARRIRRDFLQGNSYPPLIEPKLELIDHAFMFQKILSFSDLGGVWGVGGGYTFYTLDMFNPQKAILVDTHPTESVLKRSKKYPQLRFIQGNFCSSQIAQEIGQVDAVFLFDVLLHQVAPNWDEVLQNYASQTQCFVVFNQQWIGSNSTVRLLDLGESDYFQNVPYDKNRPPYDNLFQKLNQKHPDHDREWRDVHHIWQWGITDADLQAKMQALGFQLQYYRNLGQFENLKNFENHAFVFNKK